MSFLLRIASRMNVEEMSMRGASTSRGAPVIVVGIRIRAINQQTELKILQMNMKIIIHSCRELNPAILAVLGKSGTPAQPVAVPLKYIVSHNSVPFPKRSEIAAYLAHAELRAKTKPANQ